MYKFVVIIRIIWVKSSQSNFAAKVVKSYLKINITSNLNVTRPNLT